MRALVRYAVQQRVQNSRWKPHNGLVLRLDGYAASNMSGQGDGVFQMFIDGLIEEYTIETSARNAENETSGVRTNIVPKEGGNTFRGSFSADFANDRLQSNNYSDELRARGLQSPNRAKAVWMASPAFGGPVKKDKLWFFAAAQRAVAENYVAGMFENADPTGWRYVPDTSRPMLLDQLNRAVAGRVTWQATQKNKITFFGDTITSVSATSSRVRRWRRKRRGAPRSRPGV